MNVNMVELSPYEKRVDVTVPVEDVKKAYEKSLAHLKREAKIPGFRAGKVPNSVLERRFGELLKNETIRAILEDTTNGALEATGAKPVVQPAVNWDEFELDKPFEYNITFEVIPEVKVQGLDEIHVEPESVEVTDKDVDARIERLRSRDVEFKPVDRTKPVAGDQVTINYESSIADRPPVTNEGIDVELDQDALLPELYELLLSLSVGETGEKSYNLPEDYHDKELAGAEIQVKATVVAVKEKVLPELDDEFAKDNDYESLEDMKVKVREEIATQRARDAKEETKKKTLDALLEKNEFPLPPGLIENQTMESMYETLTYMQAQGIDVKSLQLGKEELKDEARQRTIESLKRTILLDALAEQEGIKVDDGDVDAKFQEIAKESGYSEEKIRAVYEDEERLSGLKQRIIRDKALDFAVSKATIQKTLATAEE